MDFKEIIKKSISSKDQEVFVKFSLLQNHTAGLIHSNLVKMLGKKSMSKSCIEKWISKIKKGGEVISSTHGGDRTDRKIREERIELIKSCFYESRHWSKRSLANRTNIPKSTVQGIIHNDLKMKKVLGEWLPHTLTKDQKAMRVLCCELNLELHKKTKNLINRTLAIDETWVSLYMEPDRNQKRLYLYPGEEPKPTVHQNIHVNKRLLIMAMDFNGIAFYEILEEKQTLNSNLYIEFLERNFDKWLNVNKFKKVWLLHDNAKSHKAVVVKEFLAKKKISEWNHPPYSPDISPLDFCCFGQLKRRLRGIRHQTWENFENNLEIVIDQLNSEGKMTGVKDLPSRWQRVIDSEGQYI